jgi:hypothetical protein
MGILMIGSTFLGNYSFPSFEIVNLSIIPKNTIKTHFFQVETYPILLTLLETPPYFG